MGIVEARNIFQRGDEPDSINWNRWRYQDSGEFHDSEFIKVRYLYNGAGGSYTDSRTYAREMQSLEQFCREHELVMFGASQDYIVNDHPGSVWYEFYLVNRLPSGFEDRAGYGTLLRLGVEQTCPSCNSANSIHVAICTECDLYLGCANCESNAQKWESVRQTRRLETEFKLLEDCDGCSACCAVCSSCGVYWRSNNYMEGESECLECSPRFNCRNCGDIEYGVRPDNGYCRGCEGNTCSDCHTFFEDDNYVEEEGRHICPRCFNALDRNIEVFDDNSDMPATRLAIPTIEGRERIRFCGLEIEGVNIHSEAHNVLAQDFYDAGLSGFNTRRAYHERYDGGFVHVERDSTCDWEVVIGPINMAGNNDVRNLNRVIKIVRERIKDRTVKLSLNCGLHIHVSAEKVGIKQAHNLHLLYTYLEDIMYRLGAAKWPMHRAVVNGDHSYQLSPRKSKTVEFVNFYTDNRYHGLSFSNYFQKMLNHCQCGAGRFGLFDECECSLTKCTFEFRIFNTTANTRKIHAYSALTQALVAKALSMSQFDFEAMPEMGFNLKNVKDMDSSRQELLFDKWTPRMKFILEELPLTDDEKSSILYCVENSELETVMGYCEEIMNANTEVVA